jgi:hypothetical protein
VRTEAIVQPGMAAFMEQMQVEVAELAGEDLGGRHGGLDSLVAERSADQAALDP